MKESSHLPGAIDLPLEFVDEAEEVLPNKRAEIVVYCMSEECEASREEARELKERGYRHVLHYAGGKQGWVRLASPWKVGGTTCNAGDASGGGAWARWRGGSFQGRGGVRVRKGETFCESACT